MPRANHHFVPGYVWHVTHRAHQKTFLLKFARDRCRYPRRVFEAGDLAGENDALTPDHAFPWEKNAEGVKK